MKKYLVLIGLAIFLVASSVQSILPITKINHAKIEAVEAVWPPDNSYFSLKINKIEAVLVNFTSPPCDSVSCVGFVKVHMDSGDIYVLLDDHMQFSVVLKEYTGVGSGILGTVVFVTPVEYLVVHTLSGKSYQVSSDNPQFGNLMAGYFGQ